MFALAGTEKPERGGRRDGPIFFCQDFWTKTTTSIEIRDLFKIFPFPPTLIIPSSALCRLNHERELNLSIFFEGLFLRKNIVYALNVS